MRFSKLLLARHHVQELMFVSSKALFEPPKAIR